MGLSHSVQAVTGKCLATLRTLVIRDGNKLHSDLPIATLKSGEKVKLPRDTQNRGPTREAGDEGIVVDNYTVGPVEVYMASRTHEKDDDLVVDVYFVDPNSGKIVKE